MDSDSEAECRPTILLLSESFAPSVGGVQTHLADLCSYLIKEHNVNVEVITFRGREHVERGCPLPQDLFQSERLYIHYLSRPGWLLHLGPSFTFLFDQCALFCASSAFLLRKHSQERVVHGHGYMLCLVPLKLMFPRVRVVLSTHHLWRVEAHGSAHNALLGWLLRRIDFIYAVSQQSMEEMTALGVPKAKMVVFDQWVDQQLFSPGDKIVARKAIGLPPGFLCVFVGRMAQQKGVGLLPDIARAVGQSGISIVAFGDGPLREELVHLSRDVPNLSVREALDAPGVAAVLNAADVCLVPSLGSEPRGRVVLEAMSCGAVVLATRSGGIPETVLPGTGELVDIGPHIAGDMAERVVFLSQHPDEMHQLAAAARQMILSRYSSRNGGVIWDHYNIDESRGCVVDVRRKGCDYGRD